MTQAEVLRLAAFTDHPAGGNPAGVVIADELPEPDDMQRIAAEVGYSETAFLAPTGEHSYRIRYFSPQAEVDFCGHATIATGVALGERRGAGTYVVTTNSGDVPVEVRRDEGGTVWATLTSVTPQQRPVPADVLTAFLDTFGWTTEVLDPAVPAMEAFGGGWHLVLALRARQAFEQLSYRFADLKSLMLERGLTTVAVVFRAGPHTWLARNPFPVGGVVEDPATGAAAAAFGGYLRDAGLVTAPATFTILQGGQIGRPSVLLVELPEAGGIRVTGSAVNDPR